MTGKLSNNKASMLILAVFTLMLLTTLAATIGLRVRGRISMLGRIEDRSRLHFISEAGIKKAIAALRYDEKRHPQGLDAASKSYRHNNPEQFGSFTLDDGTVHVSYNAGENLFGVLDEERRININTADRPTLVKLFQQLSPRPQDQIKEIVEGIVSWRKIHSTEMVGFVSDEYYQTLKQPYPAKHAPFELMDELRLVKGIDPELYDQVRPFITVYGDGQVNINTAPREVLVALGLT